MRKLVNYYIAIALIIGTVMGAGVLGIPYAIAKTGWIGGLINFIIVGFATTLMTLYMGEVVLRTKKFNQFTGLAETYLGKTGKWVMFFSVVVGMYGALTAYLIGIGQTSYSIFGVLSPFSYTALFFIVGSILLYVGLRYIGKVEFVLSAALVLVILFISLGILPDVNISNFSHNDFGKLFFPYGVILFACLGYSIIPEVEEILKRQKEKMLSAIIYAMIISLGVYLIFSISMFGVFGNTVAEIATDSLSGIFKTLGSAVAVLAMTTGYLAIGTVIMHTFQYDLHLGKTLSWLLTIAVPMLFVILVNPSFIGVVSVTGSYTGSLIGILAGFMVISARKKGDDKPAYVVPGGSILVYFSITVFAFGIIYQTLMLLGLL